MPKPHDIVVIGSGPSAISALMALPPGMDVGVVTGSLSDAPAATVHPKIASVARERRELAGVTRLLPFAGGGALADTAAVGGLANYWGQQFVRYCEGDPWPREFFTDFDDYQATCEEIEAQFVCTPGGHSPREPLYHDYVASTPNLLIGTPKATSSGLLAMRNVFEAQATARRLSRYPVAAVRWEVTGNHARLLLADGSHLTARLLVLAAGVVGSLRLTMASHPEVLDVGLDDHAPYMIFLARRPRALELARCDGLRHFNSVTVERFDGQTVRLFASFYRMSKGPLSLTLASLGLPSLFPRLYPPRIVDWLTPVQVWTPATRMRYLIERDACEARLVSRPVIESDTELADFRRWLGSIGIVIRIAHTRPGYGFHYHAGTVSAAKAERQSLVAFLQAATGNRVLCVDASTLREIGCRPHSLTLMASAWRQTQLATC